MLCHQPLGEEARARLSRFERFVQDDTQARLREAREEWDTLLRRLTNLNTKPDSVEENLEDLEADYPELVRETEELLAKYEAARANIVDALPEPGDLPRSAIAPAEIVSRLETAAATLLDTAEALSSRI